MSIKIGNVNIATKNPKLTNVFQSTVDSTTQAQGYLYMDTVQVANSNFKLEDNHTSFPMFDINKIQTSKVKLTRVTGVFELDTITPSGASTGTIELYGYNTSSQLQALKTSYFKRQQCVTCIIDTFVDFTNIVSLCFHVTCNNLTSMTIHGTVNIQVLEEGD